MRSIQNWLYNYRDQFRVEESGETFERSLDGVEVRPKLTMHGLRHAYAREQYPEHLALAALLGQGRDDVTRVYWEKAKLPT